MVSFLLGVAAGVAIVGGAYVTRFGYSAYQYIRRDRQLAAELSADNEVTCVEKFMLDYYYLKNNTFRLDSLDRIGDTWNFHLNRSKLCVENIESFKIHNGRLYLLTMDGKLDCYGVLCKLEDKCSIKIPHKIEAIEYLKRADDWDPTQSSKHQADDLVIYCKDGNIYQAPEICHKDSPELHYAPRTIKKKCEQLGITSAACQLIKIDNQGNITVFGSY